MILGDILKEYRTKHKLSMDKFAELSGLTKGYISMLEKNQHPKTKKALLPTLDTLEKVAKGMGLPVEELVKQLDAQQPIALTLLPAQFSIYKQTMDPQVIRLDEGLRDSYRQKWLEFGEKQLQAMETEKQTAVISIDDYRERISLPVPGKVSAGTGYWQDSDLDHTTSFYSDELPDRSSYDTIAQVVGDSMAPTIEDGDYLFIRLRSQVSVNAIGVFSVNGENYVKKFKGDYLQSLNPDYDDILLSPEDDIRPIGQVIAIYSQED